MASTTALLTPSCTGTDWYGLYWTLLMAAFTFETRFAEQRRELAHDPGVGAPRPRGPR